MGQSLAVPKFAKWAASDQSMTTATTFSHLQSGLSGASGTVFKVEIWIERDLIDKAVNFTIRFG